MHCYYAFSSFALVIAIFVAKSATITAAEHEVTWPEGKPKMALVLGYMPFGMEQNTLNTKAWSRPEVMQLIFQPGLINVEPSPTKTVYS